MVRQKMKSKKVKLSSTKVEPRCIEEYIQCLEEEEENNTDHEMMDLYEEQLDKNANEVDSLSNIEDGESMTDITGQLDDLKECSQPSQTSVNGQDEEMAQCVPEMSTSTLLSVQSSKISKPKENRRPKFKVTPRRKEIDKDKADKTIKKLQLSEALQPAETEFETFQMERKNKEGAWVQCSKTDCLKWRKLPNNIEPTTIPDRWVCAMNPDESHMECAASQETCDSQVDYDVVYTPFVAGSIVWAKVPGYPWWPGMVEDDPDYNCCYETDDSNVNPISYHVSFVFDKEVSRSWVSYLSIRTFVGTENPNETNTKLRKYSKSLSKAQALARCAVDLPMQERLKRFSFRVLYKGPIGRAKFEDEGEIDSNSQSSVLFHIKKKSKKGFNVRKKKKSIEILKDSPDKGEKTTCKISKHYHGETSVTKDPYQNLESENMEVTVKKRKKRKRIFSSSEDEDGEEQQKDPNETVTNTGPASETVTDVNSDSDSNNEKSTEKKPITQKNSNKNKKSSVDGTSIECESEILERASLIEIEAAIEARVENKSDTDREKGVKIVSDKKKRQKKRTKKLSESSRSIEHEGGVSSKKKQKHKITGEEKKENTPNVKIMREHTGKTDSLEHEMEKRKPKKHQATGLSKSSGEIIAKKKKKRVKGVITPRDVATPSDKHESSFEKESTGSVEIEVSNPLASSGEIPFAAEVETKKKKAMLLAKKKTQHEDDKKKTKKMKKSNSITPSNNDDIDRDMQESSRKNDEVKETGFIREVVNAGINNSISQKKIKSSHKSSNKKTKPMFGKFKAPVKSSQKVSPVATIRTGTKSPDAKSDKKPRKKHGNVTTTVPDDIPEDLECYVSIETLEKDMSILYQQLSKGETTARLECGSEERQLSQGNDCVTVEFLDDELTVNIERNNSVSCGRVTDSPEY